MVYNCVVITIKEVKNVLPTENTNSKLVETVELVERLKKLTPLEQNFIKGYIQGILDSQPQAKAKESA